MEEHPKHTISMIGALGSGNVFNRALGKDNKLIWQIPDDLKRFRTITRGHPCIMGRKTFDSILEVLGKPLPGRANIVMTRDTSWKAPEGVFVASSIEESIEVAKKAEGSDEIFIIGGAQIYELALPYADKLYLTLIEDEQEGDTFFPSYEEQFPRKTYDEEREWNGLKYHWVNFERQLSRKERE